MRKTSSNGAVAKELLKRALLLRGTFAKSSAIATSIALAWGAFAACPTPLQLLKRALLLRGSFAKSSAIARSIALAWGAFAACPTPLQHLQPHVVVAQIRPVLVRESLGGRHELVGVDAWQRMTPTNRLTLN